MIIPMRFTYFPTADVDRLIKFAKKMGWRVPKSYAAFLSEFNGGKPEATVFPISGLPNNADGNLQLLFGFEVMESYADLKEVMRLNFGLIPKSIIPIGCTDSDDFLVIRATPKSEKVYFWDRANFWAQGIWEWRHLYFVANDFESFATSLTYEATVD